MENQHKKIKGYRDLSQQEINDMNDIKAEGERLKNLIEAMHSRGSSLDQDMVIQAESYLKIGIMLAVRAIAQPESF